MKELVKLFWDFASCYPLYALDMLCFGIIFIAVLVAAFKGELEPKGGAGPLFW